MIDHKTTILTLNSVSTAFESSFSRQGICQQQSKAVFTENLRRTQQMFLNFQNKVIRLGSSLAHELRIVVSL